MRVERIMAVLRRSGNAIGYVKAECIDDNIIVKMDMRGDISSDNIVVMCIGGNILTDRVAIIENGYSMSATLIDSDISAVVFDVRSGEVLAEGSSTSHLSIQDYLPHYVEYMSKNSDAYIGVKSHIHDNIQTINDDTDDAKQNKDATCSTQDECIPTQIIDAHSNTEDDTKAEPLYSVEHRFSDAIADELESLFSRYEHEEVLENSIDSSTFVKIYYSDDSYYVVGKVLDEDGKIAVICYGYPGEGKGKPPKEVNGSYDWMPLDRDNEMGKGYYMMYQNAITGDIIEK